MRILAMYVLSSELGRPGHHSTYCLHSNSDRAYAEQGQMLPGTPHAFRKRRRSRACVSLTFLTSRSVRLRLRTRIARTPLSQPFHRASTVSPRFRSTSPLRPRTGPAGLRVARGHYHSIRQFFG